MDQVASVNEMKRVADGPEVLDQPLQPEQKRLVNAMRVARILEEGKADGHS
jgi:hypothetical protein